MATVPTENEVVTPRVARRRDPKIVLHRVPWKVYEVLRDEPSNDRVRMSYLDGILILMSPEHIHDEGAEILGLVIRGVAAGMGFPIKGLRSGTLRSGTARYEGSGKDPDNSFYIGDHVRGLKSFRELKKRKLVLDTDRPPDLAIEIDNTRSSRLALPIYARLGVPEVWRYDEKSDTIHFYRLEDANYVEVTRSVILSKLTPALVIRALDMLDEGDMDEYAFQERVKQWTIDLPDPA